MTNSVGSCLDCVNAIISDDDRFLLVSARSSADALGLRVFSSGHVPCQVPHDQDVFPNIPSRVPSLVPSGVSRDV
jgi:hypothetical protein